MVKSIIELVYRGPIRPGYRVSIDANGNRDGSVAQLLFDVGWGFSPRDAKRCASLPQVMEANLP